MKAIKIVVLATLFGIFVISTPFAPAPVWAFSHDTDLAGKAVQYDPAYAVYTQTWGSLVDAWGMFCRGVASTNTGNPLIKYFPPTALVIGPLNGLGFEVNLPEQAIGRFVALDKNVGPFQMSPLGSWAVNNEIYTGAKLGALTGGLLAYKFGAIKGITLIETYAVGTGGGVIAGGTIGYLSPYLDFQNHPVDKEFRLDYK